METAELENWCGAEWLLLLESLPHPIESKRTKKPVMAQRWEGSGYDLSQPQTDARKVYYAICTDLGVKRDTEADREFLSLLVRRPIESRAELTEEEWARAAQHMRECAERCKMQ